MAHPMLPPSNFDSSLLQRSIEQWEELLTCHQCHRIVESIARLWEGENQQSLCSHCRPTLARSIFSCINKPSMDTDDPNASDPGRVVQLLKCLLAAYQHQELAQETTTSTMSSSAIHDNSASTGDVRSTLYQPSGRRRNSTMTCYEEESNSVSKSAEEGSTKHDSNCTGNARLSGLAALQDSTLTQQSTSMSQGCTFSSNSCQERSELPDSNIQCSSPWQQSSRFRIEYPHSSMSQSNLAPTASQSTHHHSQPNLSLSLPETADFDRIFPGPFLTTQTSHQSQTERHPPDGSTTEPLVPVEQLSASPQHMPNTTSGNLTQTMECQLSINSRLPETADFDSIFARQDHRDSEDYNLTSPSILEESELPATEDFERIYPMKRQEDHITTQITSTNDAGIEPVPVPTVVVSPVDGVTATKRRPRLDDSLVKNQDSGRLPIITPNAHKKRWHEGHLYALSKPTKYPKTGESSRDPSSYSALDVQHNTRKEFPCQVRQHPFHKAQSGLGTINICARTFEYVFARANGWFIEGERGETIWGDAELYSQTVAQLSAPAGDGNSWMRKAPWWGTTRQSPCPRISPARNGFDVPVKTKLFDGYRILLISSFDCYEESVPLFDFTALPNRQEYDDTRTRAPEFKSITLQEMKSLCQAASVEILESIAVDIPEVITEKLLILVAEEIDDDVFKEWLFPRLVERRVIPPLCKVQTPPSFAETNSTTIVQQVEDSMIPIVYFSWLVHSLAAGTVAPTSPYCLGMLHL